MGMFLDLFKSRLPKGFFQEACDMHSHLLPGVDDGFATKEKTLEALSLLHRHGVKAVKIMTSNIPASRTMLTPLPVRLQRANGKTRTT